MVIVPISRILKNNLALFDKERFGEKLEIWTFIRGFD